MTNVQLAEIVDTQRETLGIMKQRISQISDTLAILSEDTEKFKNAVARDMNHLSKRIK
jgi:hypothetical protein|tara:strand:- start:6 stop:179 length:174 start_codon:yes stop_codon:yes gene_type:complete